VVTRLRSELAGHEEKRVCEQRRARHVSVNACAQLALTEGAGATASESAITTKKEEEREGAWQCAYDRYTIA